MFVYGCYLSTPPTGLGIQWGGLFLFKYILTSNICLIFAGLDGDCTSYIVNLVYFVYLEYPVYLVNLVNHVNLENFVILLNPENIFYTLEMFKECKK